ncbi:MAG TPA: hypothetical protein VJK30_01810 [Coxiellaceae bacterium]|nr:MAG: hypothetical protein A3E81_04140 [Gammaproteobacteria bacterium RIFCSPHIGHO2_12_FULL_36_30]HLB56055.1 hypothetical protein [Coxiellaceae bacterium]
MFYENCDVYLEGSLNKMPVISKNQFEEIEVTISRRNQDLNEIEFYRIILNWDDAMQIINYGYLGMSITIYGVLRIRNEVEIIAEKVTFITFSNSGSFCSAINREDLPKNNVSVLRRQMCTVH